jgi:hypothetical protein
MILFENYVHSPKTRELYSCGEESMVLMRYPGKNYDD